MPASPKKRSFRIDARAILTLGRHSIKDHTTAIIELVKNAYDADAATVEVEIFVHKLSGGSIRIADSGVGMSDEQIDENWLRIGYSEKRSERNTSQYNRRKTGEKGIGRLSADRLGRILELRSKAVGYSAVGIRIKWDDFEVDGQDLGDVQLPMLSDPSPILPRQGAALAKSGTELRILNLRQNWTETDIDRLATELGLLLPPFSDLATKFKLHFRTDVVPDYDVQIEPEIAARGETELTARLSKTGQLTFTLSERGPAGTRANVQRGSMDWNSLAPGAQDGEGNPCIIGPTEIRLSHFPRRADFLEGEMSLSQLRSFLDRNVGVRIYRDWIRVKPYGDPVVPEGDWLGLSERKNKNPAGRSRQDFRIAANQLVGAIVISRDSNPNLVDSSSREGLIEGDAFRQLRGVVMHCIGLLESRYHSKSLRNTASESTKVARAKAAVSTLNFELKALRTELSELAETEDAAVTPSLDQINVVLAQLAGAQREIDEIASQNTVYRGLATVGIASAVFGHETATAGSVASGQIGLAKIRLQKRVPDVSNALVNIEKAEKAVQQMESWGHFALLRVKKDKRRRQKLDITSLVTSILDEMAKFLDESSISLVRRLESVTARSFAMDLEVVVINFVTNAYFASKKSPRERRIEVELHGKLRGNSRGYEIRVRDSGPGIHSEQIGLIWEPLFSTKTDQSGKSIGTGLGLTIVKSAVEEQGGEVTVLAKSTLGGAEFAAWFPEV